MPFRDELVRRLWMLGLIYCGEISAGSVFEDLERRCVVPRARVTQEWAEVELARLTHEPPPVRKTRSRARPNSPCCDVESRLRRIHEGFLTFECGRCLRHWSRRAGAPHLRLVT